LDKIRTLFKLCRTSDVCPEQPFKTEMNGEDLAVFEVDGQYWVTQDDCTHGPGRLSEGFVEGNEIECPFHQGRFNILTGEPTSPPCTVPLRTWKTVIQDGKIFIDSNENGPAL